MSSDEKKQKGLTRRDFVKGTAAGAVGGLLAGTAGTALAAPKAQPKAGPAKWNYTVDIVIAGAGCSGLPAAVEAAERGASVIVIDQNFDIGGYGLISSGSILTGGGTKQQKEKGIEDSADLRYSDLIDYRYAQTKKNDRDLARAFTDLCVDTTEWLEKHGAKLVVNAKYFPQYTYGSVERGHCAVWTEADQTAKCPNTQMLWAGISIRDAEVEKGASVIKSTGAGFIRPLEETAKKMKGVQFLMEHKLTGIIREKHLEGAVLGIEAMHKGKKVYLKARKGVIIAAGGPKGNVQLRRLWDPRLTEIYQASGEPWAFHTGEGIIEAQKIGAQLSGDYGNDIHWLHARSSFGTRWHSISAYITKIKTGKDTSGFPVRNAQDVIHVNMEGKRFYNEYPTTWEKQVPYCDAAMAKGGGADLVHLRRRGGETGEVGSGVPDNRARVFLQSRHGRGAGREDQSLRRRAGGDREQIQLLRGPGERPGVRQAFPQVQDPGRPVLRRMGHALPPRHTRGPQGKRQVAGAGRPGSGHPGPLCDRRGGRRTGPVWSGQGHRQRPDRRQKRRRGEIPGIG